MSNTKPEHTNPQVSFPAGPPLLPGREERTSVPAGVSRRPLIGLGAAAIAAGVASMQVGAAGANALPTQTTASAEALTGTLADVKHVVILMQENRSFDHYYGTLGGVRGFSDRQGLEFPADAKRSLNTVFAQPTTSRPDGGVMLPFHMDSAKYNSQNAGGLDHSWGGGHTAWNQGAWNRWVDAKSNQTMGYFTREDLPFHYALADAFTICDHYFCSVTGPATPNRLYQWSGTINPAGDLGGPATDNPADYQPVYSWGTYGQELEKAGVSWKTYANNEVGDSGAHPYVGDYGDNPLWLFHAYHDSLNSADPKAKALADHGGVHGNWLPDSGKGLDVNHLLQDFGRDAAAGTLPAVSYVVAPYGWCEHPAASPDYGAHFTNAVVQAIFSNEQTWKNTVLLINYDENDGYFDHVVPPMPEAGTADEFVSGLPIGLGVRVPMTVVSPWSRGGWVNSQVFDHTSVIRFLETYTGVKDSNISTWRRKVCGDLTSAFDFARPDFTKPALPDTAPLVAAADADRSKPAVAQPGIGAQLMPEQEAGVKQHRPVAYAQNVSVTVNRSTGTVTATLTNDGAAPVSMAVYPNAHLPFAATPLDVASGAPRRYVWEAGSTDGKYDFSIYGPDRFLRKFTGTVTPGINSDVPLPEVSAKVTGGKLEITMINTGSVPVRFSASAYDFVQKQGVVNVGPNSSKSVIWPLNDGYYDVIITANSGSGFLRRLAGRVGA